LVCCHPFEGWTRTGDSQKAQAGGRAGFQRAADAAAVAGQAFSRFGRRRGVEVDGLFAHVA